MSIPLGGASISVAVGSLKLRPMAEFSGKLLLKTASGKVGVLSLASITTVGKNSINCNQFILCFGEPFCLIYFKKEPYVILSNL